MSNNNDSDPNSMTFAKPGHTVEFHGLKGATHLNGTKGTLVQFMKQDQRWAVRCELNNEKVMAKPDNLILHRNGPRHLRNIGGDTTLEQARHNTGSNNHHARASEHGPNIFSTTLPDNNAWAQGLSKSDQYEWFSNCYQMRCDDDERWGGGNLHGPYDPYATPSTIAEDFLVFCILAKRCQALPSDWNWAAFLKAAAQHVAFAFEKSDAIERWGSENVFQVQTGGRSLRYTGNIIYGSPVDTEETSSKHDAAEAEVTSKKRNVQEQVGGARIWAMFVDNLKQCHRFK